MNLLMSSSAYYVILKSFAVKQGVVALTMGWGVGMKTEKIWTDVLFYEF